MILKVMMNWNYEYYLEKAVSYTGN